MGDVPGMLILFAIVSVLVVRWIRKERRELSNPDPVGPVAPDAETSVADRLASTQDAHVSWLMRELNRPPFTQVLSVNQRDSLRDHYRPVGVASLSPGHASTAVPPIYGPAIPAGPVRTEPPIVPPVGPTFTRPPARVAGSRASQELELETPHLEDQEEDYRTPWDPAVLLLYLGVLLIVAAGIIFASYNWSSFGPSQKLGLLMMATAAFIGAGLLLRRSDRLIQAADSFVLIGALLVPTNGLAIYSIFDAAQARPEIPLLIGATSTSIVYAVFSINPGGTLYRYGTVISGSLAIATIPAALGLQDLWGAVLILFAIALVPDFRGRLSHLQEPWEFSSVGISILATLAATLGSIVDSRWMLPLMMLAVTLVLLRFDRRPHYKTAVLNVAATVTAIGTVYALLFALDVEMISAWAWVSIVMAFVLIALSECSSRFRQLEPLRTVFHVEATVLLFVAVTGMIAADDEWNLSLAAVFGIVGTAGIAWRSSERWWLLCTSAFVACAYGSLGLHFDVTYNDAIDSIRVASLLPLIYALIAFGTDQLSVRKQMRPNFWGLPFWLAAACSGVVLTVLEIAVYLESNHATQLTFALACTAYALTARIAARSIGDEDIRYGYGTLAIVAVAMWTGLLPVSPADMLPVMLAGFILLGVVGIPAVAQELGRRFPLIRLSTQSGDSPELQVFIPAAALSLLGMLILSAVYVASARMGNNGDLPGIRWTWAVYLGVFCGLTLASWILGSRWYPDRDDHTDLVHRILRWSPELTLGWLLASLMLLVRMLTTDLMIWTWIAIVAGVLLFGFGQRTMTGTLYLNRIRDRSTIVGVSLAGIALFSNLLIASGRTLPQHDLAEAVLFAIIGILALWQATSPGRSLYVYAGLASGALATVFVSSALDAGVPTISAILVGYAWVIAGTSFTFPDSHRWSWQQPIWINTALGVSVVSVLVNLVAGTSPRVRDRPDQILVAALLSTAGILAIDAWLRSDRRRGIASTAIAMVALLMEIALNDIEDANAYTVPLAIYSFGLAWWMRTESRNRDPLLAIGSALLLIPSLLTALNEGSFGWLLIAGAEALVLFGCGLGLRLRVPVAAGVVAITVIVLRMVVDVANALPSWVILLLVGLLLLGAGTGRLIWKERIEQQVADLRDRWRDFS